MTVASLELSDANILVWVQGASQVRLLGSRLHDAGGECVRLKGSAQANEVAGNVIARCGRARFNLAKGTKNGEAVYIGTAPEQAGGRPDRSDGNRVHHNRIAATADSSPMVPDTMMNGTSSPAPRTRLSAASAL